jgi:hypothetical protein
MTIIHVPEMFGTSFQDVLTPGPYRLLLLILNDFGLVTGPKPLNQQVGTCALIFVLI